MNQINHIKPYKNKNNVWVYTDENRGLKEEPFVCGIPNIINFHVNGSKLFDLYFSSSPFPDHNFRLKRLHPENNGFWYLDPHSDLKGWLCPAMFKYFDKAPPKIYCKIELSV